MMRKLPSLFFVAALVALSAVNDVATIPQAFAQALPGGSVAPSGANIRETRHNLSPGARSRQVTSENLLTAEPVLKSSSTSEICVYCHTPHGSVTGADKPLWNRQDSNETYSPYTSSSLNATDLDMSNLATPSKLCLSCHDGSIAIGAVANAPGSGVGSQIAFPAANFGTTAPPVAGSMPLGRNQSTAEHGFTRRLGNDLRNDHPIAFTYDAALAVADGELRNPSGSISPTMIANRVLGSPKPNFPLSGGQVQCSTCHDPHRNTQKFLLKNRLAQAPAAPVNAPQERQVSWTNWSFDDTYDQICLGCHTRLGKAWGVSAHSNSISADEAYKPGDAAVRDFPTGTKVWQAGCLNCHDTHTVAGSRRLLREGVDSGTSAVNLGYTASIRSGVSGASDYSATSAVENACYQCHSNNPAVDTTLTATDGVPNIEGEFLRTYRMPIKNADQGDAFSGNSAEVHDIGDADGLESQTGLGYGVPENRHVECTDCHNPHRVVKADTFLGANLADGVTTRRTHVPSRGTTGNQGNIASGALRGTWGVEPSYTANFQTTVTASTVWMRSEAPTFTVKKGDPGAVATLPTGTADTNSATYLTREYQLCFKCHSSYANGPLRTDFPQLKGGGRGGTVSNVNRMTRYTNVAAEFAVLATDPATSGTHQGEATAGGLTPVGAPTCCDGTSDTGGTNAGTINHRAWHPVIFPTGRTRAERTMNATGTINMRPPWDSKLGTQTMHCSDCHGHSESYTQGGGPILTQVQGPHGSDQPFLLKGSWDVNVRLPSPGATTLCGKCHNPGGNDGGSGFGGDHIPNDKMGGEGCMYCHTAVPHGWKNKNFLVNLRCVGQEVEGSTGDCENRGSGSYGSTTLIPYYISARLRVSTWVASGGWNSSACGGGTMEDNCPRTGD